MVQPLILGVDTPVEQIAARTGDVAITVVGAELRGTQCTKRTAQIRALRRKLPRNLPLVVGGSGAPDVAGTVNLPDLPALERWFRERNLR